MAEANNGDATTPTNLNADATENGRRKTTRFPATASRSTTENLGPIRVGAGAGDGAGATAGAPAGAAAARQDHQQPGSFRSSLGGVSDFFGGSETSRGPSVFKNTGKWQANSHFVRGPAGI